MGKIEINLTPEQEKFLKLFAAEQYEGAKNNFCTRKPLHLVQTRKDKVLFDDGDYAEEYGDEVMYYDTHWQVVVGKDIDVLKYERIDEADIISFEDAEYKEINGVEIYSTDDYFEAFGIDADRYSKVSMCENWETAAYFFIRSEAKKYTEYQAHNLNTPRIFTVASGYANNGEYEHFYDLLMTIGEQLNNE